MHLCLPHLLLAVYNIRDAGKSGSAFDHDGAQDERGGCAESCGGRGLPAARRRRFAPDRLVRSSWTTYPGCSHSVSSTSSFFTSVVLSPCARNASLGRAALFLTRLVTCAPNLGLHSNRDRCRFPPIGPRPAMQTKLQPQCTRTPQLWTATHA
ncbi:hypothetical protein L1887_62526 [Cichorium endivia]|nr:hypothetical protein L1887_62526 [Cichorium endivia]